MATCTLAHLVAGNKKQVGFEINAKKMRMRDRAKKGLESATECGRFHAERAAPRKQCLLRFTTFASSIGQGAKNGNVTTKNTKNTKLRIV